jgi:hypothetical protein
MTGNALFVLGCIAFALFWAWVAPSPPNPVWGLF